MREPTPEERAALQDPAAWGPGSPPRAANRIGAAWRQVSPGTSGRPIGY
jgi:hypothetical protein